MQIANELQLGQNLLRRPIRAKGNAQNAISPFPLIEENEVLAAVIFRVELQVGRFNPVQAGDLRQ
jgi:hypothetical protein